MSGADIDHAELARMCDKATAAPWHAADHGDITAPLTDALVAVDARYNDALLIVGLRNSAPALLAEIASLRGALERAVVAFAFVEPIAAQFTKPRPLQGDELHSWQLVPGADPATLTQTHVRTAAVALAEIRSLLTPSPAPTKGHAMTEAEYERSLDQLRAEVKRLRIEAHDGAERRRQLHEALAALVEALPKCSLCQRSATRAQDRGGPRYCDDHLTSAFYPEYPRAAPLRAAILLLAQEPAPKTETR